MASRCSGSSGAHEPAHLLEERTVLDRVSQDHENLTRIHDFTKWAQDPALLGRRSLRLRCLLRGASRPFHPSASVVPAAVAPSATTAHRSRLRGLSRPRDRQLALDRRPWVATGPTYRGPPARDGEGLWPGRPTTIRGTGKGPAAILRAEGSHAQPPIVPATHRRRCRRRVRHRPLRHRRGGGPDRPGRRRRSDPGPDGRRRGLLARGPVRLHPRPHHHQPEQRQLLPGADRRPRGLQALQRLGQPGAGLPPRHDRAEHGDHAAAAGRRVRRRPRRDRHHPQFQRVAADRPDGSRPEARRRGADHRAGLRPDAHHLGPAGAPRQDQADQGGLPRRRPTART